MLGVLKYAQYIAKVIDTICNTMTDHRDIGLKDGATFIKQPLLEYICKSAGSHYAAVYIIIMYISVIRNVNRTVSSVNKAIKL